MTEHGFLDLCVGKQALIGFEAAKRAIALGSNEVGMRTIAIQLAPFEKIPADEPAFVVAHLIYPMHLLHESEQALQDATRFIYTRLQSIQRHFVLDGYQLGDY